MVNPTGSFETLSREIEVTQRRYPQKAKLFEHFHSGILDLSHEISNGVKA